MPRVATRVCVDCLLYGVRSDVVDANVALHDERQILRIALVVHVVLAKYGAAPKLVVPERSAGLRMLRQDAYRGIQIRPRPPTWALLEPEVQPRLGFIGERRQRLIWDMPHNRLRRARRGADLTPA